MKKVVSELKRTLSLVLAFMMVATSVPQAAMNVLAEEADAVITVAVDENAKDAGFTKVTVDGISANDIATDGTGKYTISANSISTNDITLAVEYTETEDYTVSAKTKKGDAVEAVDGKIVIAAGTYEADDEITIGFAKVEAPEASPLQVEYSVSRIYVDGTKKITVKAPKVTMNGAKAKAIFSISGNSAAKIDAGNGKITIDRGLSLKDDVDLTVTAILEGNADVEADPVVITLSKKSLADIADEAVLVKKVDKKYVKISGNSPISINSAKYAVKVLTKAAKDKTEFTDEDFVPAGAYTVKMPAKKYVSGSASEFAFVGAGKVKFTIKANDKASKAWGKNGSKTITVETTFKTIDFSKLVLNVDAYDYAVPSKPVAVSSNSISGNETVKTVKVQAPIDAINIASYSMADGSDISEYSLKITYKNANVLKKVDSNYVSYKAKKPSVVVEIKDNTNKRNKISFTIETTDESVKKTNKSTIKVAPKQVVDADVAISANTTVKLIKLDAAAKGVKIVADPVKLAGAKSGFDQKYATVLASVSTNAIVKGTEAEIAIAEGANLPAGTYQFYAVPVDAKGDAVASPAKIKISVKAAKAAKINAKVNGKVKISANAISANGIAKISYSNKVTGISCNDIVVPVGASNAVVQGATNEFNKAFEIAYDPANNQFVVTVKDLAKANVKANQVGYVTVCTAGAKSDKYGLIGWKEQKIKITVKMPKAK